jgi:predicted Kef-type K+ transport protein
MSVQPNVTSKNHTKILLAVVTLQFMNALHKTSVTFTLIKHFIFRQEVALVVEVYIQQMAQGSGSQSVSQLQAV